MLRWQWLWHLTAARQWYDFSRPNKREPESCGYYSEHWAIRMAYGHFFNLSISVNSLSVIVTWSLYVLDWLA
jgi:hypothetical protein